MKSRAYNSNKVPTIAKPATYKCAKVVKNILSYSKAVVIADKEFGDNKLTDNGTRTTPELKVRIKRKGRPETNANQYFQVHVYKPIKKTKEKKEENKKVLEQQ